MSTLSGKNALVTGGSRGIGAATAKQLAADGAHVAVNYANSSDRAEQVVAEINAAGGKAFAVQADVSKPDQVATMFATLDQRFGGKLDILYANAGVYEVAPIGQADLAHFDKSLDINVRGVIIVMLEAVKRLQDHGRIIVTGSVLGERIPFPAHSAYGMSKSAVQGLVRGWARDLGPRNITVNCLQPGPIDTEMNPDSDQNPGAEPQKGMTTMGRYGRAEEVAQAVAFLARPDSGYITGGTLNVDGGIFV
ncbi:MAG: SDR family oxidoreductase [Planctomycetota bacterium]